MANYGQDIVDRGTERLKGTWEYNGSEYDLIVDDISYGNLQLIEKYARVVSPVLQAQEKGLENVDIDEEEINEQLDSLGAYSWMDTDDLGGDPFIPVVKEKLIKPEVEPETLPSEKLNPLIEGMMQTWQESDEVASAKEEMPLEGNR